MEFIKEKSYVIHLDVDFETILDRVSDFKERGFIKDPNQTIESLLNDTISTLGENIEIKRFSRFQLGELFKKQEDSE